MRIFIAEIHQMLHQRFAWLCLLGAIVLGALFPCVNLRDLDHTVEQLFGTPGILYGLLLVMAMMAVHLGKDFSERTFQQKIAQGGGRLSLVIAKYAASLLGAAMMVTTFPVTTVIFTRIYSGWHTKPGENFAYLLSDSRFHACLLAYCVGLLAAGALCFFIAALCRDLAKSMGFSMGYIVLLVMLSQKARDLASLSFLCPALKWTPVYRLLEGIHQAAITPENLWLLLFTSAIILIVTAAASCAVMFRAPLK